MYHNRPKSSPAVSTSRSQRTSCKGCFQIASCQKKAPHSSTITTVPRAPRPALNTAKKEKTKLIVLHHAHPNPQLPPSQNVDRPASNRRAPHSRLPRLLHHRRQHPYHRQHPCPPTWPIRARGPRSQHKAGHTQEETCADFPWVGAGLLRGCYDAEVCESCCEGGGGTDFGWGACREYGGWACDA